MSKKNFDAFVTAAGKKKRPSPEEIEELSQLLHPPAPASPIYKEEKSAPEKPEKQVFKLERAPVLPKTQPKKTEKKPAPKTPTTQKSEIRNPKSEIGPARRIVGKEKVRVTIDLEKGLYQRLKMQVVREETDLSTYVRGLLERELG